MSVTMNSTQQVGGSTMNGSRLIDSDDDFDVGHAASAAFDLVADVSASKARPRRRVCRDSTRSSCQSTSSISTAASTGEGEDGDGSGDRCAVLAATRRRQMPRKEGIASVASRSVEKRLASSKAVKDREVKGQRHTAKLFARVFSRALMNDGSDSDSADLADEASLSSTSVGTDSGEEGDNE